MDRNGGENLEEDTAQSAADTRRWLSDVADRYDHTAPIITPRFTPSVTDELMAQLADIAREQHLPVQSHLSENPSECGWVKELCPWSSCYGDAYDHFGLLGPRTVMAHCIYSDETETELLRATAPTWPTVRRATPSSRAASRPSAATWTSA